MLLNVMLQINFMWGKQHIITLGEEFLRNHSADRMGEKNPMYGVLKENHPMYGKKHTEEAKQKMKEARLRRGLTK